MDRVLRQPAARILLRLDHRHRHSFAHDDNRRLSLIVAARP
jgi:hypothetical protein